MHAKVEKKAKVLSWFVLVFGSVCGAIGGAHIGMGFRAIPGSLAVNATMDSEHRFYAAMFVGVGAGLMWCSRDLQQRAGLFAGLLATFFLGGLARCISILMFGWPSALFVTLGVLELILPPLLWGMHRTVFRGLRMRSDSH